MDGVVCDAASHKQLWAEGKDTVLVSRIDSSDEATCLCSFTVYAFPTFLLDSVEILLLIFVNRAIHA